MLYNFQSSSRLTSSGNCPDNSALYLYRSLFYLSLSSYVSFTYVTMNNPATNEIRPKTQNMTSNFICISIIGKETNEISVKAAKDIDTQKPMAESTSTSVR